jgi:hypothetical protein
MQEVTVNDSPANFKREHQFVAETYRHLAPFIDSSKGVYLSLDGEAAKQGVLQGIFQDACVRPLVHIRWLKPTPADRGQNIFR